MSSLESETRPAPGQPDEGAPTPDAAAGSYSFSWSPASAGAREAWVEFGAFSGSYTLWVNGARTAATSSWGASTRHRITGRLAAGPNELCFAAAPAPAADEGWPEVTLTVTGAAWILSMAVHANLSIDGEEAALAIVTELGSAERLPVLAHLSVAQSGLPVARVSDQITAAAQTGLVQSIVVPRVSKWSPREAGRPSLYDVELVLTDLAGSLLDCRRTSLGIRRIDPATAGGEEGDLPARILVNGVELPVRGAALGRTPARQCERVVRSALDSGLNLLRLPAAVAPAPAALYDAADRAGLLLWQELPENRVGSAEGAGGLAAALVAQRRGHPSLAAWGFPERGELSDAHSWALDWEDPERLRWRTDRLASPDSGLALEASGIQDPGLRRLVRAQLVRMALEEARAADRPMVLEGVLPFPADESEPPIEAALLQEAWQPLAPLAQLAKLDWGSAAQFRATVRLANQGEARSLMNVVARVLDLNGRELYSENLAGEAPAGEVEEIGELVWRFPVGLEGLLALLLEIIDEEGDVAGRSSYLFWRGEPVAAVTPPQLAVEQPTRGSWLVRNKSQRPALGVCIWGSERIRGAVVVPGGDILVASSGNENRPLAWAYGSPTPLAPPPLNQNDTSVPRDAAR